MIQPNLLDLLISAVPSRLRLLLYRVPLLAEFLRHTLAPPPGQNPYRHVTISAGPLSGIKLRVRPANEKSFWLGTYEPTIQRILIRHLRPGQTAYDVGAHVGFLSLLMAGQVGRQGKVYAFEPHPGSFTRLATHVRENNAVNVEPVRAAVSNRPGRRRIHMPDSLDPREFRLERKRHLSETARTVSLRVITLDGWFRSHSNRPPALIKIDVEGFEGHVLRGARNLLRKAKPIVLCEIHGHDCGRDAWSHLSALGYRITEVESGRPLTSPPTGGHLLALPR